MVREKKVKSWKSKKIYPILAPENFEYKEMGVTVASDESRLIGRTIDVSLSNLTKDRSKQHLKIKFEIYKVTGGKANTRFKTFMIPTGYLRSKIRKGFSKVDFIGETKVLDKTLRVKVIILVNRKVSDAQRRDMMSTIQKIIDSHESTTVDQFVQLALFGKLGTEIYRGIKKICPVGWVEVHAIKLVN